MRPETAQGIFTNFKNVQQTARTKVTYFSRLQDVTASPQRRFRLGFCLSVSVGFLLTQPACGVCVEARILCSWHLLFIHLPLLIAFGGFASVAFAALALSLVSFVLFCIFCVFFGCCVLGRVRLGSARIYSLLFRTKNGLFTKENGKQWLFVCAGPLRDRPGGQGVPERNHPEKLHLPL